MGRRPRMYAESGVYFVTVRTFQARMLLRPSDATNAAFLGVLARAVERTGVKLHAFVVASNHLHLLLSAPGDSLSSFMQYLLCNTSKKVGRLVDWAGSLWERRFSAQHVLDDDAVLGRLRYILSHGVKEGLVHHPDDWPGLSCLPLLRSGTAIVAKFFHWSRRWRSGRLVAGGAALLDERWAERHSLELAPLPAWADKSPRQRLALVDALVADIEAEFRPSTPLVLGAERVRATDPHLRPLRPKRSPAPTAFTTRSELGASFRLQLREFVGAYRQASARFRAGDWSVSFPPWSCRPFVPGRSPPAETCLAPESPGS